MEEETKEESQSEENIYDKLYKEIPKSIKTLLNGEGIQKENIKYFGELVDIYKDLENIEYWKRKENNNMYNGYGNYGNSGYGNYGRRAGYDSYGRDGNYGENYGEGYGNYGRRGRDARYRGDNELDRMYGEYGNYQESRRYGHGEETDKSFHYMVKALEDFVKVLYEEAETPQQKQMLMQTLQSSMK